MQIKYLKTVVESQDNLNRVAGLAWSPNDQKLAVATADRQIQLFDDKGDRRDKFFTKPADPAKGKGSYVIRDICFSPDSTKIAVAQSDNIVYVYKFGDSWNEKKVISNKFPQPTSVTCLTWLSTGLIVVGLDDGKLRALNSKTNKSQSLYSGDSMTISLAANTKGTGFLSGHYDGSIIKFFIADESSEQSGRIVRHHCAPFALAWTVGGIAVGGCDQKIVFYDILGREIKTFDFARSDFEDDFTVAKSTPNGQAVAFGSFNRIRIYSWSPSLSSWSESVVKEIVNMYTITSLAWRKDGSRLVLGSVSGAVLEFESVLRRMIWQDKFEVIYVAPSQVLVKSLLESEDTFIVESQLGFEIEDVRIMGKGGYLVARTVESLIICDLTRNLISEIPWIISGRHEKFYFENQNVCIIFNAGELSLVEYGEKQILGCVRTEIVNPHLISVRLNERGPASENKKLAFLLDAKTVCVVDLIAQSTIMQVSHDSKIDWLELSETAHKLLFRDKKMRLVLVDIYTAKKQTLLEKASFIQWVAQSDVVVAQSQNKLYVWYNIDLSGHVAIINIRGESIEVVRETGQTFVRCQEASIEHTYQLDEGLIEFGTAVNDGDFGRGILYLESLEDKPSGKAMWYNLASVALSQFNLRVAQRCYAALGNFSKAFYLGELIDVADRFDKYSGTVCPEVRAKLALLDSDLRKAEDIYLEQGDIENAIKIYLKFQKWNEATNLAERRGYPALADLKDQHMKFLMSSGQCEKAAQLLEERKDELRAIELYLKAKKPARAARLSLKNPHILQDEQLMNRITDALLKSEIYELAGDIAQKLLKPEAALSLYRKGGSFPRAIDIARQFEPENVTMLEEEWGDWLVSKKQLDASINHYIEAGATEKALDSAVGAKQWRKAVQIAKVVDEPKQIRKYALELSKHLAFIGDVVGAEELLLRASLFKEAIELLNRNGQWENAYKIAEQYLDTQDMKDTFIRLANDLEKQGKYRDAEQILTAIKEEDLAITMYKRLEMYDSMIRLVERYHKDLVQSTHLHLAKQLEAKGKFKNAEIHFLAAKDWKSAVQMYCSCGRFEDGYRVAKQNGPEGASTQVGYMWAKSLPIEGSARLLKRLDLLENALDFACDSGHFEFAIDLCRITGVSPDRIHLKIAMSLEDEGRFTEAETEFIKANKPKEAILMHTHTGNWTAAINVAENYLPEALNDVFMSQAASALETRNYEQYESLLIRAKRPDLIIGQYKNEEMLEDALRIAEAHLPEAVPDLQQLLRQSNPRSTDGDLDARLLLQQASEFARNEEFKKATERLLLIENSNADSATIERALLRTAEICNQFLKGSDASEVAKKLGPRLFRISQFGPAAQLYLAADLPREAVDVFIASDQWSKAKRLAKEIYPELLSYVEMHHKRRLRTEGNVELLADIDISSALDLLAEQGQWTRCLEKAKKENADVLHKYLAMYAAELIKDGDSASALALYLTHGAPTNKQNFNIYYRIATDCLAMRESVGVEIWIDLRSFLYQLTQNMKSSDISSAEILDRFELLLQICNFYATRAACRELTALNGIGVKISVALLRYTDIIPVDKGFYEAGIDLRSVGRESEAFVLLNHYLDVCEAIESAGDESSHLLDHSDLTATDFPSSVPIPKEMHLKNEPNLHEEIKEWILAVSMDQKIDQSLPTDERNVYESCLGISDIPCIVSGYPVKENQAISFQLSHRKANREAWHKLTVSAKMSPQSSVPSVIAFIEKWCGSPNFTIS